VTDERWSGSEIAKSVEDVISQEEDAGARMQDDDWDRWCLISHVIGILVVKPRRSRDRGAVVKPR
jgi:hypothetical protein